MKWEPAIVAAYPSYLCHMGLLSGDERGAVSSPTLNAYNPEYAPDEPEQPLLLTRVASLNLVSQDGNVGASSNPGSSGARGRGWDGDGEGGVGAGG